MTFSKAQFKHTQIWWQGLRLRLHLRQKLRPFVNLEPCTSLYISNRYLTQIASLKISDRKGQVNNLSGIFLQLSNSHWFTSKHSSYTLLAFQFPILNKFGNNKITNWACIYIYSEKSNLVMK